VVIAINKGWHNGERPVTKVKKQDFPAFGLSGLRRQALHFGVCHGVWSGVSTSRQRLAYERASGQNGPTNRLDYDFEDAIAQHSRPCSMASIKLRYAHQVVSNPPTIVVHAIRQTLCPRAYKTLPREGGEIAFRNVVSRKPAPLRLVEFSPPVKPRLPIKAGPDWTPRKS